MSIECNKCGSNNIALICYGLPEFSDDLQKKIDKGEIVLGGCCISDNDPQWRCNICGNDIYEEKEQE